MENLKYNQRNISGFVYDYNTANRAVCPVSTVLEIFKTAIAQGMKNYMFMFAYKGNLFTTWYEYKQNGVCYFYLLLPNGTQERFNDFSAFAQYNVIQAINSPITILKEMIATTLSTYEEVPIESNPMLASYVVGKDDPNFGTNVNENIEKMFTAKKQKAKSQEKKGLPVWGKCILFIGLFLGTAFIVGVIEAALGIL